MYSLIACLFDKLDFRFEREILENFYRDVFESKLFIQEILIKIATINLNFLDMPNVNGNVQVN